MTRVTVPDMITKKLLLLAAAISATTAFATPDVARAEEGIIKDASVHASRPTKLDVTGSLGFLGDTDVGLAGWYSFPIVKDGFIPPINDSFNLEFGLAMDYAWSNYYVSSRCDYNYYDVTPMGGVRWDFYLTKSWTVFAKAKAGIGYRVSRDTDCFGTRVSTSEYGGVQVIPDGGAGAYWNFSEGMGMRFEIGYRGGSVGLSFNL
jgi:hypothetical protein